MAKKWVNKVNDVSRVSDRMIVIKVLVQGNIISTISFYAPQYKHLQSPMSLVHQKRR